MRRKCKVFAALLLTLALTVCLALPSWAEPRITEGTTGTITLNLDANDKNVTATAYKVINVKYYNDGKGYEAPEDPEYYWVDDGEGTNGVADWVRNGNGKKYSSYIGTGTDNSVTSTFNEDNEAVDVKQFASEMAAAIRRGTIRGVSSHGPVSPTANSIVFNSLAMGTYLILVEGGTRIYSPVFVSLVPTWKDGTEDKDGYWDLSTLYQNVTQKSEALTLQKKVFDNANLTDSSTHSLGKETENEDVQVQIGDTVTYILEADVPNYPADAINTSYEISDNLPAGMSLNESSITVYGIDEAGSPENLTDNNSASNYYTLTVTNTQASTNATRHDGSGVSFNLKFVYDKLHTADSAQTRFSKIRVVYTATANDTIKLVSTSDTTSTRVNLNTAYLDYSNNPYGSSESWESVNDDANVYSYGIKVTKKDRDTLELLSGAIFTLKKDGSNDLISFVSLGNGSYRVATSSSENGATTELHVGEEEVPSDSMKGKLQLSGLDVGTYILTEVQAPAGYHKPSATISVLIQDNGTANGTTALNGKPEYTPQGGTEKEASDGYVPVTVTNTKGFTLPSTGGMGTVLFTAFGILLMGAGLVVLVLFLRRRSTK